MISEKAINQQLNKLRNIFEEKLSNIFINKSPKSIYEPANYILEGSGKRIRPLLVFLSNKIVGGNYSDVYNAAIAVELLHNFTLVHDDIMDNSDLRRGKLTVHKKYDTNTAILVGDSLLAMAYKFLLKDFGYSSLWKKKKSNEPEAHPVGMDFHQPLAEDIISSFTKGLLDVCEGQGYDKEFEIRNDVTLTEYLLMIKKKTAAMMEMACNVGASIGGGNKKEIKALSDFGLNIGMAFQINDDLLDIIGEEKEFGKNIGCDLLEGKKTFLFLKALEKARDEQKNSLNKVMINKGIKPDEIDFYKNLYNELNVIDDAKNKIKFYTKKAIKNLDIFKNTKEKNILIYLSQSLLERNK
ncbi:MAG: polyprenyl synthetase family protein [Ignavibacterium sp.]